MTDSKPEGFQPAPWEAGGKKKTQGPQANPYDGAQGSPPGYGAPQGPPGYGQAPPPQGPPLGGPAPDAFGGGDLGRARTRQIPKGAPGPTIGQPFDARQANAGQPQSPPAYTGGPPPQQGGYPAPPGPQPYPPQGGPGVPPQGQPYPPGGAPDTAYMTRKPMTVFGIVAVCLAGVGVVVGVLMGLFTFGIASLPFFLIGSILGYLGIRETAAWGKKSGRGLAMGGTIANVVLLVLNVAGGIGLVMLVSTGVAMIEQQDNARLDATLIQSRIGMYKTAKGDLQPGGPQMQLGFEQATAVSGAQLTVPDLCRRTELKNPIDQYSLQIDGNKATIWWTPEDGTRQQVGEYPASMSFDDWDWESDFDPPPPPPGRHR